MKPVKGNSAFHPASPLKRLAAVLIDSLILGAIGATIYIFFCSIFSGFSLKYRTMSHTLLHRSFCCTTQSPNPPKGQREANRLWGFPFPTWKDNRFRFLGRSFGILAN